jgi:hypothetical protein
MKRPRLLPALVGLALGACALADAPARAVAEGPFAGNALEQEAYRLYDEEKYLTARTRAEEVLRQDPDSIVGHYILGSVLREAEGSLPRAMSHLREAKRLYAERYGRSAFSEPVLKLDRDILLGLENTAGLMERYDEQLAALDEYDARYSNGLVGYHAWPLMKLHRYDEARDYARRAIATGLPWQKSTGLNAMCAIEAEAHQRKATYDQCLAAYEHARGRVAQAQAHGSKVLPALAVHAYNAALGATAVIRHDEAERLALEGTKRMERTATNPWRFLVHLYLDEGRAGDAVSGIRKMQAWCAHQPPGSRDQKSAETDAVTATLLLVAGESTAGLRFISRAVERPDRAGLTSAQPEQALGGHALLRRSLRRLDAELDAERASTKGVAGRASGIAAALSARAAALPDEERVINVMSDDERLDATLRPYVDGGLDDVPVWMTGDLVDVLGPGVVSVALSRARAAEDLPEAAPYFDELEAEIDRARGDDAAAYTLARDAFDKLPKAEALLRARAAAVAADAARRLHDETTSATYFQRSLEIDPGTVRRLGLSIPVSIRVDTPGPDAARVATLLARSPRFRLEEGAFEVHVGQGAAGPDRVGLRACLLAPFGASLGCAELAPSRDEAPSSYAARVAVELQRVVFALHLPITDTDVRSLDGTTVIARDAAREQLRGILDGSTVEDDDKE